MSHTPHTRDVALRKLKSVNRWVIACSAALTGVFAAAAANAFPGHTLKSGDKAKGTATEGSSGAHSGSTRLRPPARAPESSEEAQTESNGSPQTPPGTESNAPETEEPAQTETPTEAERPTETEKPAETERPAEAVKPAEAEAPVVSGGS